MVPLAAEAMDGRERPILGRDQRVPRSKPTTKQRHSYSAQDVAVFFDVGPRSRRRASQSRPGAVASRCRARAAKM